MQTRIEQKEERKRKEKKKVKHLYFHEYLSSKGFCGSFFFFKQYQSIFSKTGPQSDRSSIARVIVIEWSRKHKQISELNING